METRQTDSASHIKEELVEHFGPSADPDLLRHMGTDAEKWAAEFCKRAESTEAIKAGRYGLMPDEGTVLSWFANAIEAGRAAGLKAGDGG